MKTTAALITILAVAVAAVFAQGPLTPTGAPAPTMKTLAQIEPRIEINATNTPGDGNSLFKITAPGSYYLGGNVTGVVGKSGIEIATDDVTLDLNGFALIGVAGSLSGINGSVISENLVIRNGTLRGWGQRGLHAEDARSGVFTALRASNNGTDGMHHGAYATVERCTAYTNAGHGIVAGSHSTLDRCTATFDSGTGILVFSSSRVTGCTVNGSGAIGIDAATGSVISDCTVKTCGGQAGIKVGDHGTVRNSTSNQNAVPAHGILGGTGCRIVDCVATGNLGSGILAGSASTISGCTAATNTGAGISTGLNSTISNCVASGNVNHGISGSGHCTASGCTATDNGSYGILFTERSTIAGCTVYSNDTGGIYPGAYSTVTGCTASDNTFIGIEAGAGCTISGCTVASNTSEGIFAGSGSTISGCSANANTDDGIQVAGKCRVVDNNSSDNGGAGIYFGADGVRVEGNNCYGNLRGIEGATGTDCFIVRNSCRSSTGAPIHGGPSANFDFPTSNTFGPIIVVSGDLSADAATSHPWANINY